MVVGPKNYCKTIGTNGWWSYLKAIVSIPLFYQWLATIKNQRITIDCFDKKPFYCAQNFTIVVVSDDKL